MFRWQPRNQRARRQAAFTLLEVMVAIGILAFGMLGIAVMQLNAMTQGRTGKQTTEAASIAHSVLESFDRLPYNNGSGPAPGFPLLATGGWTAPVPLANGVVPGYEVNWLPTQGQVQINGAAQQAQIYNVQWQITDFPMPPPPWNPANGTPLKFIDVRVTWNEANFQGRQTIVSGVRYDDAPSDL